MLALGGDTWMDIYMMSWQICNLIRPEYHYRDPRGVVLLFCILPCDTI
jgi:hypothetical protein